MRIDMMRQFTAFALAFSMTLSAAPLFAARAPRGAQAQAATLSGTASSSTGQTLANTTVQLRDLATGQLAGTTTSTPSGAFTFAGIPPGRYAVEVVSAAGVIIGTSASVAVAAGAAITGVAVSATAAAVGAAAAGAGVAAGAAAAAGGAAAAGISTAVIVTTVAVGAGIAGAVAVVKNNASPSR